MASKPARTIRPTRAERSTGIPRWLKFSGGVLLLLVATHFNLVYQVEDVGDAIVGPLQAYTTASHRGGYYTWGGDLGIRRLRIESPDGQAYIAMDGLELDTPNWWWTLQLANPFSTRLNMLSEGMGLSSPSALFGRAQLPSADALHVRMRGLELELNSVLPPGTPNMSFASGALFETEGCTSVRYFVPLNLQRDLRLAYTKTDLSFGYHIEGADKLILEGELDAPGAVTTRFEGELQSSDPRTLLTGDAQDGKLTALRWIVNDHGFINARNQWCAEQADVDADEFQRRHITTVRRVLEVYGVRMSPETEAVYSSFAASGGTLLIEAKLPANFDPARYASYSPEQQWLSLNVRIQHNNGSAVPMTLDFVAPRRLPAAYAGSVWDLLARNADSAANADSGSPFAAMGEQMRAMTQASGDPESDSPTATPAAPTSATTPAEPAASKPREPVLLALDSASLEAAIGKRVQVETDDGRKRLGELVAVDAKTITIQQIVSGGKADLSFSRERLAKVELRPYSTR